MTVEENLASLGLSLPPAVKPVATYVATVRTGNLVYVSGQVPFREGQPMYRGSVGSDVSEDEARDAARICCLNALAAVKAEIGDLDRVTRVVRVTGYVASADGFTNQPAVINGASDLLVEAFGDKGRHSRTAIGVYQLPLGVPVEVDMIVEVGT